MPTSADLYALIRGFLERPEAYVFRLRDLNRPAPDAHARGKRTVDMQVIGRWVEPHSEVLDLGCGRGELNGLPGPAKQVSATGVDLDFGRISACVARG